MRRAIAMFLLSLSSSAVFAETTITINGKTIRTSGSSVTVNNGTVVVDGKVLSGNAVEGSGKSATENRALGNFTEVYLNISANITIIAGEKPQCSITADDNLLPLILTEYSNNALRISAKESYSSKRKIRIAVQTPLLTSAEIHGSGMINLTEVTKNTLSLLINGSGDITAKGKVAELKTTINGSGGVHAAGLEAETVTIVVNGSGDADVHVTDVFMAKIYGSGDITYIGTPTKMNTSVSGTGEIAKK